VSKKNNDALAGQAAEGTEEIPKASKANHAISAAGAQGPRLTPERLANDLRRKRNSTLRARVALLGQVLRIVHNVEHSEVYEIGAARFVDAESLELWLDRIEGDATLRDNIARDEADVALDYLRGPGPPSETPADEAGVSEDSKDKYAPGDLNANGRSPC
jgi:hypothetical protein